MKKILIFTLAAVCAFAGDFRLLGPGETAHGLPFSALFDKKDGKYSPKNGIRVKLLLAGGKFKMNIGDKSATPGKVKINGKSFDEIAKQKFDVTNEGGVYTMRESR